MIDLSDHNTCAALGDSVRSVDVLINAAAVRPEASLLSQTRADLVHAIDINLIPLHGGPRATYAIRRSGGQRRLRSGLWQVEPGCLGVTEAALVSLGATAPLELAERGSRTWCPS